MADEDQNDSGSASESKKSSDSKGGVVGPIVALIIVMGLGAGVALVFTWAIADKDKEDDKTEEEQLNQLTTTTDNNKPLFETQVPVELGEVLANVNHEQGRRYLKVGLQLWVKSEDSQDMLRPELLPMMIEVVREHLRTYDMQQLDHESVTLSIKRQVRDALNKLLREILAAKEPDRKYVQRVVLSDFLVQ